MAAAGDEAGHQADNSIPLLAPVRPLNGSGLNLWGFAWPCCYAALLKPTWGGQGLAWTGQHHAGLQPWLRLRQPGIDPTVAGRQSRINRAVVKDAA